ncbi:polysaccharide deacetylase family protein [Namhaeicola litoreus]|uniref:Polysaccharide deacetylase family protein n=1 Tax=Namhaeicola litoreus TaxID=1052145 RepID=A0ABW3XXL5_9FLAO
MWYPVKTPSFAKVILPDLCWNFNKSQKDLYLTFDDGPHPEITPWVLELLEKYQAKGTFFCVGENVEKYPNVIQTIKDQGNSLGNHTFNHLNGWKTPLEMYLDNIKKSFDTFENLCFKTNLFRPPYGKLNLASKLQLKKWNTKIVMWDVLSGDFDSEITPEKCFKNVVENAQNGSIIVFHDSLKAELNLRYVLPKVLDYFSEKGYRFKAIEET